MSHKAIREGDEWVCHKCGKRWGVDEEAPKCRQVDKQLHDVQRMQKLRKFHGIK